MAINKSISSRLIRKILISVFIVFTLTLIGVSVIMGQLLYKESKKTAENALEASINTLEKHLDNIESVTQNYAYLAAEHINDRAFLKELSKDVVMRNPYIYGSTIALSGSDAQGRIKYSPYSYQDSTGVIKQHQLEDNYDYWESDWFRIPLETGKASWSEPYFDEGGGNCWMSTYSYPIKNNRGKIVGIITADVPLDWIKREANTIHPYEHSVVTIASKEGFFIAANETFQGNSQNMLEAAKRTGKKQVLELTESMLAGKTGAIDFMGINNRYFAVFGPFKNGWSMCITCDYDDIFADMYRMYQTVILNGLIGLILIFFVCRRSIRHITQPLTEFTVSAMNMGKGNFKAQLPEIHTQDEMERLHDSMAYMQESVNTYIYELKTTASNNERMESELNIARAIQLGMLPKDFPHNELCQVHALMVPAKEVGGDLYDFTIDKDYLYVTVGDVSGKGVPASLFMAIILSAQRFLYRFNISMKKRVELINQSVSHNNETGMFCTFFAARINLKTRKMEFCNAGHNAIIIIPANPQEKPYFHDALPNLALGLFEDFNYVEQSINLTPGSRLILYTDGVNEAETRKKEIFGDDRLLETVSTDEFRKLNPEGMVNAIYTSVKNFTNNIEANDDITLLVVEI